MNMDSHKSEFQNKELGAKRMSQINAKAGLRIMGVGLNLAAISHNLGIDPTYSHKEGDHINSREKQNQDMWILDSPLDKKKSLDEHLRWLVKHLSNHYDYLKSLKPVAKIDIFCSYTSEGEQAGFSLSPKSLSVFVELGIKLELSLISF